MLSGEVLGLGIPLLFGIHRKIVYCSVLDHLLAITIFEKTDRKSKISEHEIQHRKHFFYDGCATPSVFSISAADPNAFETSCNHKFFSKSSFWSQKIDGLQTGPNRPRNGPGPIRRINNELTSIDKKHTCDGLKPDL